MAGEHSDGPIPVATHPLQWAGLHGTLVHAHHQHRAAVATAAAAGVPATICQHGKRLQSDH